MAIMITYDLTGSQSQVKNDMINNKGYKVCFAHKNSNGVTGTVYLPETTLYHVSKTPQQANDDLKKSCSLFNCSTNRVIAVELISWSGDWGKAI